MQRKLLWTFLTLFLLLVAVVSWLMMTQSGLNATVTLAQKLMPALEIQQAQGRLSDRIELSGIRYRPEQASGAEIESLTLSWQPSALLKSTLSISELTASGIDIFTVETPQTEDSELVLPDMSLPLRIELAKLSLRDINLIDESGTKTEVLQSLTSTTTVDYNRLKISQFQLQREDLSASLQGDIRLQTPYQTDLSYVLKLEQVLPTPVEVKGQLKGDTQRLTLEQTVAEPLASSQTLVVTDLLEQLHWSLTAQADKLNLADILPEQTTRFTKLQLTGEGNLASLSASLDTTVQQTDLPEIALKADVQTDDLESWSVTALAELLTDTRLNLDGTISLAGDTPTADLNASWQNLPWPLTIEDRLVTSTEGTLLLSGTQNDYQAQIKTMLDWQEESINLSAQARGTMEQLTIESLDLKGFEGQLAASGLLDWHATPLQYELSANWQDMVLPASLTQMAVVLEQGHIELQGSPDALSLTTRASLLLDGVEMAINADASGQTEKGFNNTDLTIKLAEGSLRYQGQALWSGTSLLDGKVTLANFNPGVLAPDWPGALNGTAAIKVDNLADGLLVKAQDMDIQGELRQRPVSLSGAIDYSGTLIDAKQLLLKSGQSSLTANGQIKEDKVDFKLSLQSPDLQDFYPDLSGRMNASGVVQGTLTQPAINADIDGELLQFQDIEAGSVKGKIKLVLRENADIDTRIEISSLKLPQISADTLTLAISGQQQAHQIKLDMQSDQLTLALAARGGLDSGRWQGSLQTFDLSNDKAGQWSLSQRGELTLAADSQVIPEHCWRSDEGEFCLQASHSAQSWQAAGQFSQLPLSLFEAFVAELTQLQGMLRGQFSLAGGKDTVITGEGEIFLDNASVHLAQLALNQQKPVPLNNVALRYQIDADSTTASFYLEPELDGVSAINAELQTAGLDQLIQAPDQARLQGQITTAISDLSQLQLTHPAFNDIQGQLHMNLDISGTVSQPRINGQASLQRGQIAIVDAGITLREIQADVQGDLDKINFDLHARSGDGTLTGEGTFRLTKSSWELTLMLKGRQLEVMNTPEALVIAEPDLTITVTPSLTLVKGRVHIPEAELEPTQFNSTVSPSRDVVVVNDDKQAEKGAETELDITVSLGDKVNLKAMGFEGRLTGDIRVSGKTSDILVANGEIRIKEGSYQAYGQTLSIDDGSIRFAGGAIDNPELDIKAVRKGKDYKAGLHIEGFAAAPQVNLFSEPDMSQDNILSYILLGKPLGQASATDAALLASAATGMGLKNGAIIGDQIASTFGLDEFSIAGDSAESAALQVGKYLSPKLYLSYGIGVFESVSTVELRYQLSKVWALKAESGTESGIDLLYTYERGGPE